MSFQISLTGITGTFLANIINVALPKVREQFVSENPNLLVKTHSKTK